MADRVVPLAEFSTLRQKTVERLRRVCALIEAWDAHERIGAPLPEPALLGKDALKSLRDMLVELLADLDAQIGEADIAARRN